MAAEQGSWWRDLVGYGIPIAITAAALTHGLLHVHWEGPFLPWQEAAIIGSPILVGGLLLVTSVLAGRDRSPQQHLELGLWTLGGWLHVGSTVVILLLGQEASGARIMDPWITVHETALGGALLGLLVGNYHTALQTARTEAETFKEHVQFFLRLLRHDIRNDAQQIQGYAELVAEDTGDERLAYVRDGASRIVELTHLTRAFTDEESAPSTEARPLATLLETILETTRKRHPEAEIRITGIPSDEVQVRGDELLRNVFENLVRNAVQHHDGDEPRVRITVDVDPDTVEVRVADDGPGVPEAVQQTLFQEGAKGGTSAGSGLGLYLVHVFVTQYGGRVELEHTGPDGSTFLVVLPRAGGDAGDAGS